MTEQSTRKTVDQQIDEHLKRVYNDAASEPLPDKFLSLLALLKAKEEGAHRDN